MSKLALFLCSGLQRAMAQNVTYTAALFTLSHAPEAHYVKHTPLILASSGQRPDRLSPEIRVLETEIARQIL